MITNKHWKNLNKTKFSLIKSVFPFLLDVFRTGKLEEIFSFFIWECYHKSGLFKPSSYLRINEPLTNLTIEDFFGSKEILFKAGTDSTIKIEATSISWHVIHFDAEDNIWGTNIEEQNILLFQGKAKDSVIRIFEFPDAIKAIYISGHGEIFVCSGGKIYRSQAKLGSTAFECVLSLLAKESVFRHNNTFTETPDGTLLIGEYLVAWNGNKCTFGAVLYFSTDTGITWQKSDFLRKAKVNKHIHLVRYSPLFKRLILTEGDNKKRLWAKKDDQYTQESIDDLANWENFTKHHIQMGGYTTMAEINGRIIFGSDYMGGTNFIVKTTDLKKFTRKVIPDPYRRAWINNMVVSSDNIIWATLRSGFSSNTRSLLMFSMDDGETWNKVLDYDGTKYFLDIVSSSIKKQNKIYFEIRDTDKKSNVRRVTKVVSFN
jgi:hypothetical protein